jgi:hypothetical protein
MTLDEWKGLATMLAVWWQGDFGPEERDVWWIAMCDHDRETVFQALKLALRTSPTFRPKPGEIIALCSPDADSARTPSWPEARQALFGPRGVVHMSISKGDDAALERAEQVHPYLAAYCQAAGLQRLRMEEVDDPDHGGAVIKRLGDEYSDHVRRCDERIATGRSLEAMGRHGELARLNPLAALDRAADTPPPRLVEGAQ